MPASSARAPRVAVFVNGLEAAGVLDVFVEASRYLCAGRFRVRAALNAAGPAPWSGAPLAIDISVGLDGEQTSLITGLADRVSMDPIQGEVVVEGRDMTSVFIGAQVQESFENQTSSAIAEMLAARHGLAASVTPTSGLTGRYYQNGRTRTGLSQHARAMTEWDLLCWLAQLEHYDVWTSGRTLCFQPILQDGVDLTIGPGDCISLHMHHALDLAQGVTVEVASWDAASQAPVTARASNASAAGSGLSRRVVRPNLSSADATALAQRLVAQISAHERSLEIEMPGDLVTAPRQVLQLAGTGTDFDGLYQVCAVERHLSFSRGYVQTVQAGSLPWTSF